MKARKLVRPPAWQERVYGYSPTCVLGSTTGEGQCGAPSDVWVWDKDGLAGLCARCYLLCYTREDGTRPRIWHRIARVRNTPGNPLLGTPT